MISSSALRSLASIASRSSIRVNPTLIRSSACGLASYTNSTIVSKRDVASYQRNAVPPYQQRAFSSMGMMPRRGFPQYTVFDQSTALSIRAQMPIFKKAGADGVSVDRRGKLILEFVPRNTAGTGYAWDNKTVFSLGAEEVGLCVSQLPGAGVELSHKSFYGSSDTEDGTKVYSGEMVDKVLTIEPKEGAAFLFKIDFVKNGVGGQSPDGMDIPTSIPLEVTLQAGEFEVVKSIFQTSIPYLLGWNATMDLAAAAAISKGVSGGSGGGGFY
ncbi:hypothetical protein HJC23_012153 [Cyclotella cryptica]|uniref:Uncharacterized protein n=1 Tax=Cyclotella cryptica TaxID=29204 RepID=A0ABD3PJ21_9STRA|eukprot:CCRYP_014276-RA/>CCRYP_014276-RA protein AED:0.05 eAED:0.05 QI:195/1/1/1/1/1/2/260/270